MRYAKLKLNEISLSLIHSPEVESYRTFGVVSSYPVDDAIDENICERRLW